MSEPVLVEARCKATLSVELRDLRGGANNHLADHRLEVGVVADRVVNGQRAHRRGEIRHAAVIVAGAVNPARDRVDRLIETVQIQRAAIAAAGAAAARMAAPK